MSAVVNKTISHAYIINGEKSTGKAMLARTFATSIMCEAGSSEPCGQCSGCTSVIRNSNPDVVNLIRDSKKKTDIIGIDEIRRQIIDSMYERPYNGDHKVYIIDNADKMNIPAQNAILKTLEEPPEYATIILLTQNSEKLLPTIISRCIVLNMRPVKDDVIKRYLREQDRYLDTDIDVITAMASGNVGKAKLLSEDEEFGKFQEEIVNVLIDLPKTGYRMVRESAIRFSEIKKEKDKDKSDSRKYSSEDIFNIFMLWYRDVLFYKATDDIEDLVFKNKATEIALQAKYFSFDGLEKVIKEIADAKSKVSSNINYEAIMELLLINIQEISK